MSTRMIVTSSRISRREKSRRRFHHWWNRRASPEARLSHLMVCKGCVGCTSILGEIETRVKESNSVAW